MARPHWHPTLPSWVVASSFVLVFGMSPLGLGSAAAQQSALLKGVVADEATGKLIPSAAVTLVGTETKTKTGDDGTFVFPAAPLGKILVRVQATGYPAVVEEIEVAQDIPNVLPVFLQSAAAALEGIVVFGTRTPSTVDLAASAADLVAQKIPDIYAFVNKAGGPNFPTRLVLRGRNTLGGSGASGEPMIVLDGVRMTGGLGYAVEVLRHVPASNVKNLQILRGSTSAFLYGAPDGVIIVETFGHGDSPAR